MTTKNDYALAIELHTNLIALLRGEFKVDDRGISVVVEDHAAVTYTVRTAIGVLSNKKYTVEDARTFAETNALTLVNVSFPSPFDVEFHFRCK